MMPLNNASPAFEQRYASHLKHLKLQGLQTKTVDAYARAIRTMGEHFDWRIDTLSEDQLTDYFHQRIASHSWSAVKLDLYACPPQFETQHTAIGNESGGNCLATCTTAQTMTVQWRSS